MIAENEGLTGAGGAQNNEPAYAFPHGPLGDSYTGEDGFTRHQLPASTGMTLLEWFASQEKLTDFDADVCDAEVCDYPPKLVEAVCGPIDKNHDWSKTPKLMFEREAKIRAWMKFTRAQAMLDESNRRQGQ